MLSESPLALPDHMTHFKKLHQHPTNQYLLMKGIAAEKSSADHPNHDNFPLVFQGCDLPVLIKFVHQVFENNGWYSHLTPKE